MKDSNKNYMERFQDGQHDLAKRLRFAGIKGVQNRPGLCGGQGEKPSQQSKDLRIHEGKDEDDKKSSDI